MCFRLRKDSVSDLIKFRLERSSKENARELLAINLVYLYLLHAQSFTRFQGYCEQKGLFLSFLENPADIKRKF